MEYAKYVIKIVESHQFVAALLLGGVGGILSNIVCDYYLNKIAQISTNKAIEKFKHEIQQRYLHIEIKTKNLLEIYPKLNKLMREAGSLILAFDVLKRKINDLQVKPPSRIDHIKSLIEVQFYLFSGDNPLGIKDLAEFTNYYEESTLFISEEVDLMILQIKSLFLELYNLAKKEIASKAYRSYSEEELDDLLKRATNIIDKITIQRAQIVRQMKKEFNPFQNEIID